MNLEHYIARCPIPHDPDRGAEALALWGGKGPLADVIQGAGGCSPYLLSLLAKERDWLIDSVTDMDKAIKGVLTDVTDFTQPDLDRVLRQSKRRIALLTGLADLAGTWNLEQVTHVLTDFADAACQSALSHALSDEIRRGKLPSKTADDIATGAGMTVLAMGKMGAGELNYSSDIDLICLFDETQFDADDFYDVRTSFVRATRKMSSLMNDLTGDGYVFRTDLRLRPDSGVTPVCMAMEAAERYYESLGRTWERAAYIKARPCAGDIKVGNRFLDQLRPFVWRKHLDFAAIQDAHDMRLAIREHKGLGGDIDLAGHNMKLGRGGIREIEFFTQTRQLIAGGRDPDLRMRQTVAGLAALAEKDWISHDVATGLSDHYRFHRMIEHRIQMVHDAQTHDLPKDPDGLHRIAHMCGMEWDALSGDIFSHLTSTHNTIEGFFSPTDRDDVDVDFDTSLTDRWPSYPALRSERGRDVFERLKPDLMARLAATEHPEEGLIAFDGFLAGLPAGVQLFSLFEVNPQLIDLLLDIVGTSQNLAQYLSRNASVFDAVIGGGFFEPWPGADALEAMLSTRLNTEQDYEHKLDAARRWQKEWHFRIGVHFLRDLIQPDEAAIQYSDLARAVIRTLWPVVQAQFAKRHGSPPGRGAVVLGMGSLGAGQLNAGSDLDLIVIYDADGAEGSEGVKPLSTRPYYARLTQAMITAVSAPMSQGRLYEIDMRLRPSGTQGPVATSLQSFESYQKEQAWVWEHLALTRAEVIAGPVELTHDIHALRDVILTSDVDRHHIASEVLDMREKIASAKPKNGALEPKIGAGRMQDVDLFAQAALLMSDAGYGGTDKGLRVAKRMGWLTPIQYDILAKGHRLFRALQQGEKLLGSSGKAAETLRAQGQALLLRATGTQSVADLLEMVKNHAQDCENVITEALNAPPKER